MNDTNKQLKRSTLVMRITGWGLIIGIALAAFVYSPGFLWGSLPPGFPQIGPRHLESPYHALHPYILMMASVYFAWAVLLIRGCRDPKANAALFDLGILANTLHGLIMIPQAFVYPNEHAHLWTDIPMLFAIVAALWIWHPNRVGPKCPKTQ